MCGTDKEETHLSLGMTGFYWDYMAHSSMVDVN